MNIYFVLIEFPAEHGFTTYWLLTIKAANEVQAQCIAAERAALSRLKIARIGIVPPDTFPQNIVISIDSQLHDPEHQADYAELAERILIAPPSAPVKRANIPNLKISEDPLVVRWGDEADAFLKEHGLLREDNYVPGNVVRASDTYHEETQQRAIEFKFSHTSEENLDECKRRIEFILPYVKPIDPGMFFAQAGDVPSKMQIFKLDEPSHSREGIYTIGHHDGQWWLFKQRFSVSRIEHGPVSLDEMIAHCRRYHGHAPNH